MPSLLGKTDETMWLCVTYIALLCSQAKEHAEEQGKQKGEQTRNLKISLWRALWTGFGWPYISLGLLKLFSDALNFAGKDPPESLCKILLTSCVKQMWELRPVMHGSFSLLIFLV